MGVSIRGYKLVRSALVLTLKGEPNVEVNVRFELDRSRLQHLLKGFLTSFDKGLHGRNAFRTREGLASK